MDKSQQQQHLQAQAKSGESVAAYCSRHNLNKFTFYKWRSEFNRQTETGKKLQRQRLRFKEVTLGPRLTDTVYRINLSDNLTLCIPQGFNPEEAKILFSILHFTDIVHISG